MHRYPTGNGNKPYSILTADFDNDNRLDIVVGNSDGNTIGVFLALSDGTFATQKTYSTGLNSEPYSLAIGDFNNDNRLDIAVGNYLTNSVGIFLGWGNGTFATQPTFSIGRTRPVSMDVGDFNNDHRLDIALVCYSCSNISVLFGYGDGTFVNQTTYSTGFDSGPMWVSVGDLNNDNRLDIVVANSDINNVGIFLGYDNGTFVSQTTFETGRGSRPVVTNIGDFNNDYRQDIVVGNYYSNSVGVFLGHGNGTFENQRTFVIGINCGPQFLTVGDFNNDNQLDVFVTCYNTISIVTLLGYGNGTFRGYMYYTAFSYFYRMPVAAGDFNKDNWLDIATAYFVGRRISITFGYGNGSFISGMDYSTGYDAATWSIGVGDFNNDTRLDMVVANAYADNIGVFLGYGDGTFTKQRTYSTGEHSEVYMVAVGDLNNDDRLDIAIANYYPNNVGIFLGNGDGTFGNQTLFSTGTQSGPRSIAIGDFNNDTYLDIAVANSYYYTVNSMGVFLGYGNGNFAQQTTYSTGYGSETCSIVVGDVNNDKRLDIVVANRGTDNVGVFIGYGNGTFARQATYPTGYGSKPYSVVVGDFNNDTHLDIAVANFGTSNVGVLLGYGNGTFTNETTFSTGVSTSSYTVAVGDFNHDAQLDIAVANPGSSSVDVLLGYGNGTFVDQITFSTGPNSGPVFVVAADFNNDERLDIAVANCQDNSVGIFLNAC
jgi:hypothetical protein